MARYDPALSPVLASKRSLNVRYVMLTSHHAVSRSANAIMLTRSGKTPTHTSPPTPSLPRNDPIRSKWKGSGDGVKRAGNVGKRRRPEGLLSFVELSFFLRAVTYPVSVWWRSLTYRLFFSCPRDASDRYILVRCLLCLLGNCRNAKVEQRTGRWSRGVVANTVGSGAVAGKLLISTT